MGLLTIFKRKADGAPKPRSSAAPVPDSADAVQRARVRARQRLIGAVVLVVIGIIGFPLIFETQPRPIPLNIPIEIPRKDGAPPLAMPADRAAPADARGADSAAPGPNRARGEVTVERREDTAPDVKEPTRTAEAAPKQAAVPPEPPPKPAVQAKVSPARDGARARALLEGKPAPKAEADRFVVQVGAFADASAAREVRRKVEKLGLKSYTQVVSTAAGDRVRVRAGPFATRGEAEKALAKARSAGLTAVVLTL